MPGNDADLGAGAAVDKRRLDALGVLLPIRLHALSFLPGRHPLGRAGEGMRFLRARPYEPGQDNPRDIDKFSAPDDPWVNEWESEAQAAIRIYADVSGSMSSEATAAVRNLALLQLTYSLWRASDRVRAVFYGAERHEEIAERNLRSQLDKLAEHLATAPVEPGRDVLDLLAELAGHSRSSRDDLIFVVSDFHAVRHPERQLDVQQWRPVLRALSCDVVPVIVSFELSPRQLGQVKLWDPERNRQRLTLLTPARARRINREERQRVEDLVRMFRSLGLDCLVLRDETDVYPALAALARVRRKRCK